MAHSASFRPNCSVRRPTATRPSSSSSAARLCDNDGLRLGPRRQKRPGVSDGLHTENNTIGARVGSTGLDHVPGVHVEHGANRYERAEPDVFPNASVEDCSEQCSALTDKCDVSLVGPRPSGGRAHLGAHYAKPLRGHDTKVVVLFNRLDVPLQCSTLLSPLPDAGRDNHEPTDTRSLTFLHHLRDCGSWSCSDSQINVRPPSPTAS